MTTSARDAVRAEVLALLGDGDQVVATITQHVPAYAALSAAQLQEARRIATWTAGLVLDLWVQGAAVSAADVKRFTGIGAARALDGRPLPAVLRAYRLAGVQLVETVERVGGSRLTVTDAMALARLWMSTVDTLSEAVAAGHGAAADRLTNDREQAVLELLEGLVLGRHVTRTGLADRGRELGVRVPVPALLLVVVPAPGAGRVTSEAFHRFLDELLPDHGTRALAGVRSGEGVALLPAATPLPPAVLSARDWRGAQVDDVTVTGIPRAFRLLEHLVEHAPQRAFAGRALLDEADAHLVGLLTSASDADAGRLAQLVLSSLRGQSETHLLEGLQAYTSAGSATEAATRLGLHAQTMRYRLRRLRELTGRDPRRPWDRLVLEAAALAAGLSEGGS